MSLSTCEKCGGHIPLGPDASNRCESCGLGVFDAHTDPFPMGHLGEFMLETRNERNELRARVAELEGKLRLIGDFAHDRSQGPAIHDDLWWVREQAYDSL